METKIYIFSTGSELTTGKSVDTNSIWIANEFSGLGYTVQKISVLPDDPFIIKEELKGILNKKEKSFIIMTGGLGATADDYTLTVICDLLNVTYHSVPSAMEKLLELSKARGKQYTDILDMTKRQTCIPNGSIALQNEVGLAPGFLVDLSEYVSFAALPGVPTEMKHIFTNQFLPEFKKRYGLQELYYIERYIWLIGETIFQENYIKNNPLISESVIWGVTAKPGYIKVTFTSKNKSLLDAIKKDLPEKLKHVVDKDIPSDLHEKLCSSNKTLATAESCTGGLISKLVTDRAGSSSYFLGAIVSYHNNIKNKVLSVKQETLDTVGAVSKETAKQMVEGLESLLNNDYSISVTGIAGPGGATPNKKVGLVYIGIKCKGKEAEVFEFNIPLKRDIFREYVANVALYLLYTQVIS